MSEPCTTTKQVGSHLGGNGNECLRYTIIAQRLGVFYYVILGLYHVPAEDESEISFEPGDIIRDVETLDKAWWRGWSKDGRQGLFPANYVETI